MPNKDGSGPRGREKGQGRGRGKDFGRHFPGIVPRKDGSADPGSLAIIDAGKCAGCGVCVGSCPAGAISMGGRHV